MYRDAARAFLDVGMCDRAPATIELAKGFSARIGEDKSIVDLTGNNQTRLEQLRRCWDESVAGAEPSRMSIEHRRAAQQP